MEFDISHERLQNYGDTAITIPITNTSDFLCFQKWKPGGFQPGDEVSQPHGPLFPIQHHGNMRYWDI